MKHSLLEKDSLLVEYKKLNDSTIVEHMPGTIFFLIFLCVSVFTDLNATKYFYVAAVFVLFVMFAINFSRLRKKIDILYKLIEVITDERQ